MSLKKILFIIPSFNFGGTVFSTLNMISFLKKDYDVLVLPMTYQGPVIKSYIDSQVQLLPEYMSLSSMIGTINMEYKLLKKIIFFVLKLSRKICSWFGYDFEYKIFQKVAKEIEDKYDIDFVVSCQEGNSTYFASCFNVCKKIAWFRNEYSIYILENPPIDHKKNQMLYPLFDSIVCVSETTRTDFISYFPDIANKVKSIHNIQNVSNIVLKSKEVINDFPSSPFVIVSVGRINPQKRFSQIPSIARKILDAGCEFTWIIIGDGNVYGEWERLQVEIQKNGVNDNVKCLGGKLNPYPYIQKANLLVNVSYVEACPRVVIESKILNTPVICADFSSATEFTTSGYDGYVETIDNIHAPIIELIKNPDLYATIKNTCNSYSIGVNKIYDQLKNLFK